MKNLKLLPLLILPLLAFPSEKTLNAAGESIYYRTIETDASGFTLKDFIPLENANASKNMEVGSYEKGATLSYRFKGTYLKIIGYQGMNAGKISVQIDGKSTEIDTYYKYNSYQKDLYEISNLSDEYHDLVITTLDDKWHAIDAIVVKLTKEVYEANYNLAQIGNIICSVENPTGGGNHNLEVIRNEKVYEVGVTNLGPAQYDSYNGSGENYFYMGFTFDEKVNISKFIFQEGDTWADGGWFKNGEIEVQYLDEDEEWIAVDLIYDVDYPDSNSRNDFGQSCEIFTFIFETVETTGIRIYGLAGGTSHFVSVAQLEVYANEEAISLHEGYSYKDATIFELKEDKEDKKDDSSTISEEPKESESDSLSEQKEEPSKKGCKGDVIPSIISLFTILGSLLIKRKER